MWPGPCANSKIRLPRRYGIAARCQSRHWPRETSQLIRSYDHAISLYSNLKPARSNWRGICTDSVVSTCYGKPFINISLIGDNLIGAKWLLRLSPLHRIKVIVASLTGQEVFMSATFYDPPLIEHDDFIGIDDGT